MRRNWGIKILTFAVFVVLGGASVGTAAVPPPPVNQNLGVPDTILNALSEADCRVCHDSGVPDRHHILYGAAIPEGVCNDVPTTVCQDDADCQVTDPNDYCIRDSQAPNAPGVPSGNYECLTCHTLIWNPVTMAYEFDEFRDCLECHSTQFQPDHLDRPQEPNVHHRTTTAAEDFDCMFCHGSLVNNLGDGHYIPTYDPSLVTPWPSEKGGGCDTVAGTCELHPADACTTDEDCSTGGPNGEGNCIFCHNAGTEGVYDIIDNHDTHHGTGLTYITLPSPPFGGTRGCYLCHPDPSGRPNHDAFDIRTCERCHGPESLHNIQVDSNGGGIVPGGEDAYYGHIGNNDDCFGCHGFTSTASAPFSGPVVPYVQDADTSVMTAGSEADVTLTGVAFTNLIEGQELISGAALTAPDGSTTSLAVASVTQAEMVVSVSAGTAGKYALRAEKGPKMSNPTVIAVTPLVEINSANCSGGTVSVTGSGFSGYVNATDSGTSITSVIGGVAETGSVISWTDTQIVADFSDCGDSVSVSSVFGGATGSLNTAQSWGPASVVGAESGSATDLGNCLAFLLIPAGTVLLLKVRRRRK